jgi:hypothetical protein
MHSAGVLFVGFAAFVAGAIFTFWLSRDARQFVEDFDWVMSVTRTYSELERFLARGLDKTSPRTWRLAFQRAVELVADQKQIHEFAQSTSKIVGGDLYIKLIDKWDALTDKAWQNAPDRKSMVDICIHARDGFENYDVMLGRLLNLLSGTFQDFLDIAWRTDPKSATHKFAAGLALGAAASVKELDALQPFIHSGLVVEFWQKKAELETRSDMLVDIMNRVSPATKTWQIAFDKLKAMPDPALEHSSTYAFP